MKNIVQKPSPKKLAHLGTLTSALVHELRNPLNAIKANLQLMEEDMVREEDGEGRHTRRVRRLLGEVERLEKTLNNFFVYIKSQKFEFSRISLGRLVGEVVSLITPQADREKITVLADLEPDVSVEADAGALKQALLNLANNSLHAMESRGGTLIFRIRDTSAGLATIEVTDTGVGIPEEQLNSIFDLFYTTREGGTGIGLAVVSKILQGHGGKIRCSSEVGRGTSFVLDLPKEQPK